MQKRLVDIVNSHCLRRLGTLPDLVNPTGYNEKLTTYQFTGNACSGATLMSKAPMGATTLLCR